jgi:putative FmdB family regulatory protein
MPIYAYRCEACGHAKDVLQKISDAPLTVCPSCGESSFRKQLTAAGFQLKGSGWYVTDFRDGNKGAKAADKAADKAGEKAGEGSGDKGESGAAKEGAAPASADASKPSSTPASAPSSAPAPAPAASTPAAPSPASGS